MCLRRNFERKPSMKEDFLEFMPGLLYNHHSKLAPSFEERKELWYRPIFWCSIHKSLARSKWCSISLLPEVYPEWLASTWPESEKHSLVAFLIRFRKEPPAVMADIRQIFHCCQRRKSDVLFPMVERQQPWQWCGWLSVVCSCLWQLLITSS